MCNSITLGGCSGAYLRSYFAQGDCFALGGCSPSVFGCGFGGCGMDNMMMSAGIGLGYGLGSLFGKFLPTIGKAVWSGIKWVGNGIWSGLKWIGNGIWSGLKGAWNGIKSIFKKKS